MNKLDYKKDYKDLYLPKKSPVIVTVPSNKLKTVLRYKIEAEVK
ncbi:hypothetical protein [Alkaliphilus flagellatus]|nr:hypothetical protein [Alkaliphilus flagellatus]